MIRLENLGRKAAAKVTPELVQVFKRIRQQVLELPSGAIERELYYKTLLRQLVPLFRGANTAAYQSLSSALRSEVEYQVKWAEKFIDSADAKVGASTVPSAKPPITLAETAGGITPRMGTIPPTLGPGNYEIGSSITRTQLMALADDTEVLGKRLDQLFQWSANGSPYTAAQIKRIDRAIKQGFMLGETNEEIARNITRAGNGAIRDTRAIARTGVMDMSQRAHERFWDENSDRIKLWEYDATFDYRVCPLCYPYEGKRAKERSSLPDVPRHPNCRCRVLPVTATELALEKEELAEGMEMSIVDINKKKSSARGRVYKTKVRVDGEMMVRSAREIKLEKGQRPTMGQFLDKATPDTREAVLGKVRADEFNYITSSNRGPKRKSVEDALLYVTKGDANSFARAQRSRNRRR